MWLIVPDLRSANQKNFGQIVSPPLTDIQGSAAKAEPPCLGGVTRTPPRHANGVGGNGRVVGLGATNGPLHCVAGIHRHCFVRRSFGRAVANLHSWEPMTREPNSLQGRWQGRDGFSKNKFWWLAPEKPVFAAQRKCRRRNQLYDPERPSPAERRCLIFA